MAMVSRKKVLLLRRQVPETVSRLSITIHRISVGRSTRLKAFLGKRLLITIQRILVGRSTRLKGFLSTATSGVGRRSWVLGFRPSVLEGTSAALGPLEAG